jgi:hypothetical protein
MDAVTASKQIFPAGFFGCIVVLLLHNVLTINHFTPKGGNSKDELDINAGRTLARYCGKILSAPGQQTAMLTTKRLAHRMMTVRAGSSDRQKAALVSFGRP